MVSLRLHLLFYFTLYCLSASLHGSARCHLLVTLHRVRKAVIVDLICNIGRAGKTMFAIFLRHLALAVMQACVCRSLESGYLLFPSRVFFYSLLSLMFPPSCYLINENACFRDHIRVLLNMSASSLSEHTSCPQQYWGSGSEGTA